MRNFRLLVALISAVLGGCSQSTPGPRIALLGDSLFAQMVGVQSSLAAPFNTAQNIAVSGVVTADIVPTVARISPSATHVIVGGGINNFSAGTAAQIVPNYGRILKSIPPEKMVIAVGVVPVDWELLNALRPDLASKIDNARIAAINAQIVALCRSFANCRPALSAMQMDMVGKTSDGMHLTPASYHAFVAAILSTF